MTTRDNDQKFMRPLDVTATRRNRHRVRATRLLVLLSNLVLATLFVTGGYWLLHRMREDARFAIRTIEILGVEEVRRQEIGGLLDRWEGANLFRLEMEEVRRTLAGVDWVGEVTVEKMLPDRMRVDIRERVPEAIVAVDGRLRFIDREGIAFGEASVDHRDRFPVIEQARGAKARRCVEFLEALERSDPALHSRVDRIRPAGSFGWELVERDLGTIVLVGEHDVSRKWRMLYGILAGEGVPGSAVSYADLRFDDQIVIGHEDEVSQE